MIIRCINLHLHSPSIGVVIISGTERNGGTYNFRNGTELCFGFYKNMIISGTERRNGTECSDQFPEHAGSCARCTIITPPNPCFDLAVGDTGPSLHLPLPCKKN